MPLDENYFAIMASRGLVWRGERFVRGTPAEVEQAKMKYGSPKLRPASELEEIFYQGFKRAERERKAREAQERKGRGEEER
jgi:hypothetical protein